MEEEGESSKSLKSSVPNQRDKSVAAPSRYLGIFSVWVNVMSQFGLDSTVSDVIYKSAVQLQDTFLLCVKIIFSFLFRKQESESSSDSDSDSDSEFIGPPVPSQHTAQGDDDELVGPPLPPSYTGSRAHSGGGDDDEDEGDAQDDDDDVCLKWPT